MIVFPLFPKYALIARLLLPFIAYAFWRWAIPKAGLTDPAQRCRALWLLHLLPLLSLIIVWIQPGRPPSLRLYTWIHVKLVPSLYGPHPHSHFPAGRVFHPPFFLLHPPPLPYLLPLLAPLLIRLAGVWFALVMGVAEYGSAAGRLLRLPRYKASGVIVLRVPGWTAFTFGLLKPRVFMSEAVWQSEHREAILAHEQEHVQRRDPLRRFLAQGVRRLLWYLPFWQRLADQMEFEAERVCDRQACRAVGRPRYARALLAFVNQMPTGETPLGATVGFFARPNSLDGETGLPARIRAIDRREEEEAVTPRLFWPVFTVIYFLTLITT